ncbi:pyridoxamine 5'-phosphate oxidase family protein [Streptomyces sp. NPDC006514]|uniref:pyridoxamine 5'-phosphate oxidase family protein n=1 Tax=Streptomyces sp. NPDC006514 TaxID=3154308 RepID=UPI0033B30879
MTATPTTETPAQTEATEETEGPARDGSTGSYEPTDLTVPSRSRDRARYDRETVHSILDGAYVCHLGFVRDGAPVVLPTLYARVGESLYMHGSTGSRPLLAARRTDPGLPVCVTVTHVDGLVLARSAFHHSLNYRSVVVHGTAHQVTDEAECRIALDAMVDAVAPGRSADVRPANARELAATAVIRVDLAEVSAKIRSGPVNDDAEDLDLPYWAGVVPVAPTYGTPVPAADLAPGTAVPDYLSAL